ncbi:MAG: purine-binding chemotaxis protein CheW [Candidatus Magnetomorum sp.]|nr:purine-binding chemotaxis protein CheW [Candidatus Magnetomorum sp.]
MSETEHIHVKQFFVFRIDSQRFAITLDRVQKVIRAIELINVPESLNFLMGLINMEGRIIPVFDIRQRFLLPPKEMDIQDRILISSSSRGTIAVIVDDVEGIVEFSPYQMCSAGEIFPNMEHYIEGVWKDGDNTAIVYDVDKLFPNFSSKDLKAVVTESQS